MDRDLDSLSFALRRVEDRNEMYQVACEYDPELYETMLNAVDRRVEVTGTRKVAAGRRAEKLRVIRVVVLDAETADEVVDG